jgi:hypothetical protein
MEPAEPRSTNDIIYDLLQIAIETQWSDRKNTSCHCHPEYAACCPECDTLLYDPSDSRHETENEHKPDCRRMALIREADAYLRVENELAEENGGVSPCALAS